MSGGRKATVFLSMMAVFFFSGFYIYSRVSGDKEGIEAGLITAGMLLLLAILSNIKIRPWKK